MAHRTGDVTSHGCRSTVWVPAVRHSIGGDVPHGAVAAVGAVADLHAKGVCLTVVARDAGLVIGTVDTGAGGDAAQAIGDIVELTVAARLSAAVDHALAVVRAGDAATRIALIRQRALITGLIGAARV